MSKKIYMAPTAEKIIINNEVILAGSLTGNGDRGLFPGDEAEADQGAARSMRFDVWEDIDETNGYK